MPKKLKGGGSEKINDIVFNLFSKDKIEYLPLSSIFINNISHKYVHMVNLLELRKIIDNNTHLKKSNIIMNIYRNKHVISLNEIYNNIELTMLNDSLEENVKLLFQFIMEYNVNRYVRKDTDIFSIITCNEDFDEAYETEISMTLLNKMFDIRDIDGILENTKGDIMNEKLFRELVESKMRKCSEKPYSLMDLFTGEISFDSNKKCELPNNKLLRLNGENLIFLSDNINNLSYGDKMKLLILFEHRLSLLSKYFSLEVLRRKNVSKSNVKKLLNKISQLDIAGNSRTLTKRIIDKNNDIIDSDINKELSEDSDLSESNKETSLKLPSDMTDSGESITSSSLSEPSEPSVSVSQPEEADVQPQLPLEENDLDKDKLSDPTTEVIDSDNLKALSSTGEEKNLGTPSPEKVLPQGGDNMEKSYNEIVEGLKGGGDYDNTPIAPPPAAEGPVAPMEDTLSSPPPPVAVAGPSLAPPPVATPATAVETPATAPATPATAPPVLEGPPPAVETPPPVLEGPPVAAPPVVETPPVAAPPVAAPPVVETPPPVDQPLGGPVSDSILIPESGIESEIRPADAPIEGPNNQDNILGDISIPDINETALALLSFSPKFQSKT